MDPKVIRLPPLKWVGAASPLSVVARSILLEWVGTASPLDAATCLLPSEWFPTALWVSSCDFATMCGRGAPFRAAFLACPLVPPGEEQIVQPVDLFRLLHQLGIRYPSAAVPFEKGSGSVQI